MNKDEYVQAYKALGIPIKQLPSNYTPEEFGRRLRSMSQTEHGVSYAASTDYVVMPRMSSDIDKNKK